MNTGRMLTIALLAQSLLLPAWAATAQTVPSRVTELTPQETRNEAYRHTGDVSLTNYPGTAEEALRQVRAQVGQQGDQFYRVTRLQMMENSTWSVNAATYMPAQNASVVNLPQDKESL